MDKVSEDINHILAKWDPIRVGENIATDEYKGYIPMILHLLPNRQELMEYLEDDLPKLTLEQAKFKQHLGLNEWDELPEGVEYPE